MGPEAFRGFVEQLDAVETSRPFCSSSKPESPRNGEESGMLQGGGDGRHVCPVTGRFGSTLADPRRTLLERRLEAAETLAGPFALRLEADGVYSVKVLARVPVRAWDLPPCLVEQVERMIGLLAARTCATEHYQAHNCSGGNMKSNSSSSSSKPASSVVRGGRGGGHLRAKKRVGLSVGGVGFSGDGKRLGKRGGGGRVCRQKQAQHMLAFDPRFQRSAVDPFGRPPRLERVQTGPDPGQHRVKGGDRHRDGGDRGLLEIDEDDDLAPGPWDRPRVAEGRAGRDETGDHIPEKAEKDKVAPDNPTAVGATATTSLFPFEETPPGPPSFSLSPTTSITVEPEDTQHELYRKLAAAHPEQQKFDSERRKPLGQPRPRRRQSRQRGGGDGGLRRKQPLAASNRNRDPSTNAVSKKDGNPQTRPEALELTTRRRLTCRVPHCSAVFTSLSTLHTHERSHAAAPEYHRLRRAPQLFRDVPPAPSEGEGADAARFRLRTTLPASVRRELQQLQEESAHRRRGSLLSLPGLAGAAATWAGVVGPGRKVGGSV